MQKFLVCPAVGGASVTFGALLYLIKTHGDGLDPLYRYMAEHPDEKLSESQGEVGYPEHGLSSPLLTAWWKLFTGSRPRPVNGNPPAFADTVHEYSELHCLWGDNGNIRCMLVPFVERCCGDYRLLDRHNNNTPLRIVEVPDGYHCGVTEDPETGCEFVEEYPKIWHARDDDDYAFIAAVKKFCAHDASKHDWYNEHEVYDLRTNRGTVSLVLSGKYGVARCTNAEAEVKYMFIRKNEYYRPTDDHPEKAIFEICNLVQNRFSVQPVLVDAEQVLEYARLTALLETHAQKGGKQCMKK